MPARAAPASAAGYAGRSQILRPKARVPSDASEHPRADFVAVMKRPDIVRPASATQRRVTTRSALHGPSDSEQCREDPLGLRGTPRAHAAWNDTLGISGTASP